jgi:hypothetical protein
MAKEIFDLPFCCASPDFDYGAVKTVSFFFPGNKEIDIDALVKPLIKRKGELIVTGKSSIEGAALSPDIAVYIIVKRNDEKAAVVNISANVNGMATKAVSTNGEKYSGSITISGDTLVFAPGVELKEIEKSLSTHLQSFIDKILDSSKTKPKFFLVH